MNYTYIYILKLMRNNKYIISRNKGSICKNVHNYNWENIHAGKIRTLEKLTITEFLFVAFIIFLSQENIKSTYKNGNLINIASVGVTRQFCLM